MAKVEIELEELTYLKGALDNAIREKEIAEQKLRALEKDLDVNELRRKAIVFANKATNIYIGKIFESLGFDSEQGRKYVYDISGRIGRDWINKDIKATISVELTDQVKRAFINLGVAKDAIKEVKHPLEI